MIVTFMLLTGVFYPCLFMSVAYARIEISSSPIFLFQSTTDSSCNSHAMSELNLLPFKGIQSHLGTFGL